MLLTGLSSPTVTACWASVSSDEAIGSLVKVICANEAGSRLDLRALPLTEASSGLAAASAADLLVAMNWLAWIWPLSSPLMVAGCAAMNAWVATRLVVTNWPLGHRLASSTSTWPPAATICASAGAGSQPPAIDPDWNASTASEFGVIGVIGTSPPPVEVLVRPCVESQWRSATSWVLPSEGVASFWPLSCAAEGMLFLTTSSAPPDAAPEITLISLPSEVCQALMAGFGPT